MICTDLRFCQSASSKNGNGHRKQRRGGDGISQRQAGESHSLELDQDHKVLPPKFGRAIGKSGTMPAGELYCWLSALIINDGGMVIGPPTRFEFRYAGGRQASRASQRARESKFQICLQLHSHYKTVVKPNSEEMP